MLRELDACFYPDSNITKYEPVQKTCPITTAVRNFVECYSFIRENDSVMKTNRFIVGSKQLWKLQPCAGNDGCTAGLNITQVNTGISIPPVLIEEGTKYADDNTFGSKACYQ